MGEWICSKCGLNIKTCREKHFNSCDGNGPRRYKNPTYKRGTQESKNKKSKIAKKLWENNEYRKRVLEALEKKIKNDENWGRGRTLEKEESRKEKIRIKINERYANGWEVKCGRCKKIEYISDIAGIIKVDGSWELKVAQYLDKNNIRWERNKKRFDYINLKNKKSTYCPDFYIYDWNTYLEVKGYKTELDDCKWSQFAEPLIVWNKQELKKLKIL